MKRLVLVGAGHAHAHVLRTWSGQGRGQERGEVELTLVSPDALAPYSGMIPGWMAGYYGWEECCIDFGKLCRDAGARFLHDQGCALDTAGQCLRLAGGGRVAYDLLSLDIGATALLPEGERGHLLAMRPLAGLEAHWRRLHAEVSAIAPSASSVRYRVLMIGGGAAGVESLLATRRQLAAWAPGLRVEYALATNGSALLPAMAGRAGRLVERHFRRSGIEVVRDFGAQGVDAGGVHGRDGRYLRADTVLWATGAGPHAWPTASGLAADDAGFVKVDATLRSVSHPNVFAAGDCAGLPGHVPKAGVYAVRMGPVLAHNLHAALDALAPEAYRPQKHKLVLLGTADGRAIAAWGPFAWEGAWVWRWKQWIDRRFIARQGLAE